MDLVFDIGGTNTRISISEDGKTLGDIETFKTSDDLDQELTLLSDKVSVILNGRPILRVSGAVAGLFNSSNEKLLNSPNLSSWNNQPLKDKLEELFHSPVILENDAALEGLGEAVFGAGKESSIVGYLSIGTGAGGARVTDQKIDRASLGFEPGHQIIDKGHDLESKVSGESIVERFNQEASQINNPAIWREICHDLAVGLTNMVAFWSPEVIILGGGVSKFIPLQLLNQDFIQTGSFFPHLPKIILATLGDQAGLLGALLNLKYKP